jgi:peptidoglycan/LPS O-acetylase OafA/YrhL
MKYRPDIDGIRAIAILLVVLFHYGAPGFTGGFLGVDVFFVLSGYLIGSIVFAQLRDARFSFVSFYFRRVRRLYPAYIAMMVATLVAAYFWLLPLDLREFGQSLIASIVYLSNILFFREAGYFDTASHLKPLLHTWSLSVEEQFYLVFPFVAWATAALRRRHVIALFIALTIASFVAAITVIDADTSAVFYLYPFRAWEMFLGTLLALGFVAPVRHGSVATALSVVGLGMIIGPAYMYDETTLFPGLAALVPCLGTALLLHAGGTLSDSPVQRVLASRVPVYIGKISYSLYLWHWPVYVLYAYRTPDGLSTAQTLGAAVVTFTASVLCYRYIETPVRKGTLRWSQRPAVVFPVAALASFVFVAVGLQIHRTNGLPERLDERTAEFAAAAGDIFRDMPNCRDFGNERIPDIQYCALGDPFDGDSYTLVWGDSHAAAFRSAYAAAFEDLPDNNTLIAWTGGCPPVFGLEKDESVSSRAVDESCTRRNATVARLIENDDRINSVVLIGRWSYYANGGGVGVDSNNRVVIWPEGSDRSAVTNQAEYFVSTLEKTIGRLNELEIPVFVVEQPPEFPAYEARMLAMELMNGGAEIATDAMASTVAPYSAVRQRQGPVIHSLESAETAEQITLLRTHKYFCDQHQCSLMLDDEPGYFDNNHLSTSGSLKINSLFAPIRQLLERNMQAAEHSLLAP